MSEVDYTQFVYKKRASNRPDKKQKPTVKPTQTPASRQGKSNKLFVFVVILLCFGLVFFAVDFFKHGKLTHLISRAFAGNSYSYYLVVSEHPSRALAYEHCAVIKKGGGSGYVWHEDKYYVVYSLYTDKSSATAVANKNTRTYVKSVTYTSKKNQVCNFCDTLISSLSSASHEYETGKITESELLAVTQGQLQQARELRESLQQSQPKVNVHLLNLVIESLNNIKIVKPSKIEIISDIRYVCSSIAINMGDYI